MHKKFGVRHKNKKGKINKLKEKKLSNRQTNKQLDTSKLLMKAAVLSSNMSLLIILIKKFSVVICAIYSLIYKYFI